MTPKWIVHKFGGSSVADAGCFRRVAAIVEGFPERRVALVLSACRGVTDELIGLVAAAAAGDRARVDAAVNRLRQRHEGIASELLDADATVHFGDVSMPIGDLIEALRAKHAGAGLPPRQASGPESSRQDRSWARGARLVRCRCGVVKAKGARCRECGE